MIDGNLAMNSHFENMSEKDSNDMADHYVNELVKKGMKEVSDQFLSYLDENIVRLDKTLAGSPIQSRRFEDAMEHRSVYASVKEKYLQLINNQLNESKG